MTERCPVSFWPHIFLFIKKNYKSQFVKCHQISDLQFNAFINPIRPHYSKTKSILQYLQYMTQRCLGQCWVGLLLVVDTVSAQSLTLLAWCWWTHVSICSICIVCIVGMIYISPIYTFITHSNSFSVLANTAEMLIMSNVTVTKIWGIECPKICSQV